MATAESEQLNGENDKIDFTTFVALHHPQLQASNIPERYWKSLHEKLSNEVYDAGDKFQIIREDVVSEKDEKEVVGHAWKVIVFAEDGVDKDDENNIFLIDHAWTYRVAEARQYLEEVSGLLERMENLMDLTADPEKSGDTVARIERVLQEMWKFNQTYKFGHLNRGSEEAQPIWYVMDEFGSRIQHSDDPSCNLVPFFYAPSGLGYSLLWPLQDLEHGDEVTRDYAPYVSEPLVRKARLLPWRPMSLKDISYRQTEPEPSYFQEFKLNETLPQDDLEFSGLPKDRAIKVYMDYAFLAEHLTDHRFQLVELAEEADIIWTRASYKDFREFSELYPDKMINQFPGESVVTVKDLLAIISRRATPKDQDPESLNGSPRWLPVTYNLKTELPKFVSHYQHRDDRNLDNHWICKPWNLARSLDMHITSNLNYIIRLTESGPKIACKYVEEPVLFQREDVGQVKFDIRYIVLLASIQPLKLYAYKVFWLRFANRPYSLDHFDEYEKHFTVMNYSEGVTLKQINCEDFIPLFESQYPSHSWSAVESKAFTMFRQIFEAAVSKPYPQGIHHSLQSRAVYAVDFLLGWETDETTGETFMQPKLCEVNFAPDCDRACRYHPHFINDIFSTLFLDDPKGKNVVLL